LALEAQFVRGRDGASVTLPVRVEAVRLSKRVVVTERVVVRRRPVRETTQVQTSAQRERLRLDVHGDLEVTQPLDRRAHD